MDTNALRQAAEEAYDLYFEHNAEVNLDRQFCEFLKHLLTVHQEALGTQDAELATLTEETAADWYAERQG
jgi:hypothetical protein